MSDDHEPADVTRHPYVGGAVAWADFNDVDPDGIVTTLAKFATSPLTVGQSITVRDDDGNTLPGVVRSIDRIGIVTVQLDAEVSS